MRLPLATTMLAAAVLAAPAAAQTVIDFETTSVGTATSPEDPVGTDFLADGLTFTDASYFRCDGGCPDPDDGIFVSGAGTTNPFTATFTTTASDFSFFNVSFSDVTATAFDALGNALGTITDTNGFEVERFTFAFDGIKRVEFSAVPGESFGVDRFSFDLAAVPEPATWGLMIGGVGMVGGAMRRRRAARVTFATA